MDFPTITEISSKNKSWKKNPGNLEFGGNIDLDGRHLGPDSRIGLKILLSFNLKIIHQLHIDIRLTLHRVEIIVKLKNKRLKNLKHLNLTFFLTFVPSTPLIFSDINWFALLICFFKPGRNAMFVTCNCQQK